MAAGSLWQDHGLIFASEVGSRWTRTTSRTPSSGCASGPGSVIGIRTSYVTRAPRSMAQGTPLHVVSEVLGHASIAITKDVYGHLLEGDGRAAAESMSPVLFGG